MSAWPFPLSHAVILMAEEGVDCPLWTIEEGMLFGEAAEFVASGGPSDIADDLARWAAAIDQNQGEATPGLDAEAADLCRRLKRAYAYEVRFLYRP